MTELKTLNELIHEVIDGKEIICEAITIDKLRQEAIKWIKYWRDLANAGMELKNLEGWVQHFFNITEKDLEEK